MHKGRNNVYHTFKIEFLPVDVSSTIEQRISLNDMKSKTFIGRVGEFNLVKLELCITLSLYLCEVSL